MADTATATGSEDVANETANQRQARLRREKRQKKMAEEGEDRLARIKALNGGVAPPDEVLGGPGAPQFSQAASMVDDPDEVDISQNTSGYGTPQKQDINAKDDPLAAAMMQMRQQEILNQQQKRAEGSSEDDPMVRMMEQMQQMMGATGGGGDPNDPNAKPPELPPMLKSLMGGMAGGGGSAGEQAPPATGLAYVWKIVHAVFAFMLASYIAMSSTFNGSKLARSQDVSTDSSYGFGQRLFLIFCTAELVLQSSRYFAEKGQLQGNGMFAKVANSGFVPEPWSGYVRVTGRYVAILQTIIADAMVIVFVFGALAWWQGKTAA